MIAQYAANIHAVFHQLLEILLLSWSGCCGGAASMSSLWFGSSFAHCFAHYFAVIVLLFKL